MGIFDSLGNDYRGASLINKEKPVPTPAEQQALNDMAEAIERDQSIETPPDPAEVVDQQLEQERQRRFAFQAEVGEILAQRQIDNLQPRGTWTGHQSSTGPYHSYQTVNRLTEAALDARAAILTAALKYRAITRNRPVTVSIEAHMATDDRVVAARLRVERELVSAGLIEMNEPDFALNLIPQGLQIQTPSKNFLIPL